MFSTILKNILKPNYPIYQTPLINQLYQKLYFNFGFLRQNSGKSSSYQIPFKRWKIVKGDQVIVNTGSDKGKIGIVLKCYRRSNRVLVKGVNIKHKRYKSDVENDIKGGVRTISHSIHVSNVSLIDPQLGVATRIRFGYLQDGTKVRISKKTGSIIEKVMDPGLNYQNRNKNKIDGINDTPPIKVMEVTYKGEDFVAIKKEFEEFIKEKERKEKLLVFDE